MWAAVDQFSRPSTQREALLQKFDMFKCCKENARWAARSCAQQTASEPTGRVFHDWTAASHTAQKAPVQPYIPTAACEGWHWISWQLRKVCGKEERAQSSREAAQHRHRRQKGFCTRRVPSAAEQSQLALKELNCRNHSKIHQWVWGTSPSSCLRGARRSKPRKNPTREEWDSAWHRENSSVTPTRKLPLKPTAPPRRAKFEPLLPLYKEVYWTSESREVISVLRCFRYPWCTQNGLSRAMEAAQHLLESPAVLCWYIHKANHPGWVPS